MDRFELRDGVWYYTGTNIAPDFTSAYWKIAGPLATHLWYMNP